MNEQDNVISLQALAKYYMEKSVKLEQDFVLYKLQCDAVIESLHAQLAEFRGESTESSTEKSD
jgi:hypothetical protein